MGAFGRGPLQHSRQLRAAFCRWLDLAANCPSSISLVQPVAIAAAHQPRTAAGGADWEAGVAGGRADAAGALPCCLPATAASLQTTAQSLMQAGQQAAAQQGDIRCMYVGLPDRPRCTPWSSPHPSLPPPPASCLHPPASPLQNGELSERASSLTANISSLYSTAKLELQRKDLEITELRERWGGCMLCMC